MKKQRTWVKTFMPCMAPKVEDGSKQQTVRPWPKRERDIPKAGERISCREWTGKPYATKQRILREETITEVLRIKIRVGAILLCRIIYRKSGGIRFEQVEYLPQTQFRQLFARKDGFDSLREFQAWFLKKGATEFTGMLIKWKVDDGYDARAHQAMYP